jgi:hypothetical protein
MESLYGTFKLISIDNKWLKQKWSWVFHPTSQIFHHVNIIYLINDINLHSQRIWQFCDFVIYVEYYSRFITIYFLKHKFEVFNTFQNYIAFVKNQIGHKIKTLWSNNGNEFISNQLIIFVLKMELHVNLSSLICMKKMV